jgi:hypothetical protein
MVNAVRLSVFTHLTHAACNFFFIFFPLQCLTLFSTTTTTTAKNLSSESQFFFFSSCNLILFTRSHVYTYFILKLIFEAISSLLCFMCDNRKFGGGVLFHSDIHAKFLNHLHIKYLPISALVNQKFLSCRLSTTEKNVRSRKFRKIFFLFHGSPKTNFTFYVRKYEVSENNRLERQSEKKTEKTPDLTLHTSHSLSLLLFLIFFLQKQDFLSSKNDY